MLVRPVELLERSQQLAALCQYLTAVCEGTEGRAVLVSGEAGVSKTALNRRLCAGVIWRVCCWVVLVLEDVHRADGAPLDVLCLLGRRLVSVGGLVIASYRDTELGQDHPLRQTLSRLASHGLSARMRLAPLSAQAVAKQAEP